MKKLALAAAAAGISLTSLTLAPPAFAQDMALATGQFRDADSVHRGSGNVIITKSETGKLMLELSDFTTLPGPDLKVWLVEAADIQGSADVKQSQWLALGPLQSPMGDQSYSIPAGTDISVYQSAIIWCETFGVLFTTADLN